MKETEILNDKVREYEDLLKEQQANIEAERQRQEVEAAAMVAAKAAVEEQAARQAAEAAAEAEAQRVRIREEAAAAAAAAEAAAAAAAAEAEAAAGEGDMSNGSVDESALLARVEALEAALQAPPEDEATETGQVPDTLEAPAATSPPP